MTSLVSGVRVPAVVPRPSPEPMKSLQCVLLAAISCLGTLGARGAAPQPDDISPMLAVIREARGVPALAAGLIRSNRVVALGVAGVRKQGVGEPATLGDLWHVGSVTKSMTATLVGLLVQEGRISWTNTLAASFPAVSPRMHPAWRAVTLSQLLRHRGGAPDSEWLQSRGIWDMLWNHPGTPREQRAAWLESVVTNAPPVAPGTEFVYSNTGYVFAGMMLEATAGEPWEDLISRRLFAPLGMTSAGFGVPARPRFIDQPWGHQWADGRPKAVPPGPDADNPSGLGPAGTVHLSLGDLLKYAAFHAREGHGVGLLSGDTFRILHDPVPGESYAMGWKVATRPWAGGTVLTHTGSNRQWFAVVWIAPGRDAAAVAVTNIGDNEGHAASTATDEAVATLIGRYLQNSP